jgi:predicted amidohydrolase YtcJ
MSLSVTVVSGRIDSVLPSRLPRLTIDGVEFALPPGAVILPGLVDAHCHLIGLGMNADRVDLRQARSADECADRVRRRALDLPPGSWIEGFGWNQEEWSVREMPDRSILDAVVPDHPVMVQRIDSHALWVNTAALRAAEIVPGDVAGGSIEVDAAGEPSGILIDNAMKLVERLIPPPSVDRRQRWIERSVEECLRYGITEIHDMNVEPERLEPMVRAAGSGGLRIRCNVFLQAQNEEWRAVPGPQRLATNLDIVGVKYFTDGALGSRGALLLEPYADEPGTVGIGLLTSDELEALAVEPLDRGFAVATHAIGDAANRLTLDAYERLRERFPLALLRVEHAQIVHPNDVPRFSSLRAIPSMQPTHCTSDVFMAEARLGIDRCGYAYGWADLRALGLPILGGSDFPIETPDPLAGLRAFDRREPFPGAGAWFGRQRLSRPDALRAYTAWAPLGLPDRPRRGELREGFDADLAVVSGDPFEDDVRILATIVGGRVEYEAP